MRALAVRQPWASLIVEGLKTIEVRKNPITISYPYPERVAIYATKKIPTSGELGRCFDTLGRWENYTKLSEVDKQTFDYIRSMEYNSSNTGVIMGTVEITNCKKIQSCDYTEIYYQSYAPASMIDENSFIWELKNPIEFETPIPIKWPSTGSWAKIELPGVE